MKRFVRTISVTMILLFTVSLTTISFVSGAGYSSKKGSVTVVCGSYKRKFKAATYGSISKAIVQALKTAGNKATAKKPATVTVAKGNYYLSQNLVIYSNTTLNVTGCKFKQKASMLRNGYDNNAKSAKGYKGTKNIAIIGGVWDVCDSHKNALTKNEDLITSTFRLAHCKNVTISKCTFKNNYAGHDIELGGVHNAEIKNCTFKNTKSVSNYKVDGGRESIQIDINTSYAVPDLLSYDNTPSRKISIHNCTFKNKFRAIGSHHAVIGKAYENISIYNNKFENIAGVAVSGIYMNNVKIYGNKMTNVGSGINIDSIIASTSMVNKYGYSYSKAHKSVASSKSYIYGNTIKVRSKNNTLTSTYGIRVAGDNYAKTNSSTKVRKGTYYIHNVSIGKNSSGEKSPNIITGNIDMGVSVRFAKNTDVSYNIIKMDNSKKINCYGVDVRSSKKTTIRENKITNTTRTSAMGIFLSDFDNSGVYNDGTTIENNKITTYAKSSDKNFGIRSMIDTTNTVIRNNTIDSGNECVSVNGAYDLLKTKKYITVENNIMDTVLAKYHFKVSSCNIKATVNNNFTSIGEECISFY